MRGLTDIRFTLFKKEITASRMTACPTAVRSQPLHEKAYDPVPGSHCGPIAFWKCGLRSSSEQPSWCARSISAIGTCVAITSARSPAAPSLKRGGGTIRSTWGSVLSSLCIVSMSQRRELT